MLSISQPDIMEGRSFQINCSFFKSGFSVILLYICISHRVSTIQFLILDLKILDLKDSAIAGSQRQLIPRK